MRDAVGEGFQLSVGRGEVRRPLLHPLLQGRRQGVQRLLGSFAVGDVAGASDESHRLPLTVEDHLAPRFEPTFLAVLDAEGTVFRRVLTRAFRSHGVVDDLQDAFPVVRMEALAKRFVGDLGLGRQAEMFAHIVRPDQLARPRVVVEHAEMRGIGRQTQPGLGIVQGRVGGDQFLGLRAAPPSAPEAAR